jgi:transposase-like protein
MNNSLIRDNGHVQNQAIYVVLGVDLNGQAG